MGDTEVKHQRYRTRWIHQVTSQLDVPTSLTSVPNHLLCFHFVCCPKEVSKMINNPVVNLPDTQVGGTSTEVVPQGVNLKLPGTTDREW
jgi:hypothetical protein